MIEEFWYIALERNGTSQTLDSKLRKPLIQDRVGADWAYMVQEDFPLVYFVNYDYLMRRLGPTASAACVHAVLRNPKEDAALRIPIAPGFTFAGYDLIERKTGVSALASGADFADVIPKTALNAVGLLTSFDAATTMRRDLAANHPDQPRAKCELMAIWSRT